MEIFAYLGATAPPSNMNSNIHFRRKSQNTLSETCPVAMDGKEAPPIGWERGTPIFRITFTFDYFDALKRRNC